MDLVVEQVYTYLFVMTVADPDRLTRLTEVGQLFENIKCKSAFKIKG